MMVGGVFCGSGNVVYSEGCVLCVNGGEGWVGVSVIGGLVFGGCR